MRKLFVLITVLLTVFALFACGSDAELNANVPMGSIGDTNYATYGNISLTEKDLYNLMRVDGYSHLTEEIEHQLVSPSKYNLSITENADEIKELINLDCYSTNDLDTLNQETKDSYVEQFIDNLTLENINTNDGIYSTEVMNKYLYNLARKYYAKSLITSSTSKFYYKNENEMVDGVELTDDNGDPIANPCYISPETLENYYNENLKGAGEFEVIILGFKTVNDAQEKVEAAGGKLNGYVLSLDTATSYKQLFEDLYQTIFSFKPQTFTTDSDDLTKYNSTLVSLIKDLKADEYTEVLQDVNGTKYLVYKITDPTDKDFSELSQAEKDEALEKVIESFLTDSFISTRVSELLDSANVKIYDPIYSKLYKRDHEDYSPLLASEWNDSYNNYIACIEDKNYSVQDFYKLLESKLGPTSAMGYFVEKAALEKYGDLITDSDMTEINNTLTGMKSSFESNSLSSYPQTLTMGEFLYLYYGSASEEEVVDILKVQKIWNHLQAEYGDELLPILEKFSKQYYDNYFALDIVHILISVDYDMDGNLDDPELFKNNLDEAAQAQFDNDLLELAKAVLAEANFIVKTKEWNNQTDALKYIADRYTSGYNLLSDDTKNWNDYKSFNFALKVESLSTVSTSNASNYVEAFSNGVKALYKTLAENDQQGEKYLPETVNASDLIKTNYGYHILTSLGTTAIKTANYTSTTEYTITWKGNEEKLTAVNENNWANQNQIKIYLANMMDSGSSPLNSTLNTVIEYIYSSFTTRYKTISFQNIRFVYNNLLNKVSFANAKNTSYINNYYSIQKRVLDNYVDYSQTSGQALAGWWDEFKCN